MASPTRRRLEVPRPPREVPDYANLYRYGEGGPAPLLVYVGGATSLEKWLERFHTEPLEVVGEVRRALDSFPFARLDALICPSGPPIPGGSGNHTEDFFEHFETELLPRLEAPTPSAIAFVGYSYGAGLATYLALGLEASRALVTVGGTGVVTAAEAARPYVPKKIDITLFANSDDQVPQPHLVAAGLKRLMQPLSARAMPPREGGHKSADYLRNGTLADAFRAALVSLATP
jgi:pimeloyl-ACP methyl ester carboxylesterase